MSLDNQFRSGGLKSHTTLDTDDGIAHVAIATNGIRSTNLFNLLDGGNLIIKLLTVDGHDLTFLEGNL